MRIETTDNGLMIFPETEFEKAYMLRMFNETMPNEFRCTFSASPIGLMVESKQVEEEKPQKPGG